jgi:GNAT superfamily N-acetyltransferase
MSSPEIRRICAKDTLAIRSEVLRPGREIEEAMFPGDGERETVHLGAFLDSKHVGVTSLYHAALPEHPEIAGAWQLRGMATMPEVRGKGCGHALLKASLKYATDGGASVLWCNARIEAAEFYRKEGFEVIGPQFEIPDVGPHFRMWLKLSD